MKHVYAACAFVLLVLTAAWVFGPPVNPPPVLPEAHVQAAAVAAPGPLTPAAGERPADRDRILQLEAMATRQTQMEQATHAMPAARQQARAGASTAWQEVLATNQAVFRELFAQARKAERGEVPCTICDGYSYMPCVMCRERDGKCVTCRGSGHRLPDVLCPTCLGSGKCYLCTGSRKMFCPFCDDGMIQSHKPEPPTDPPLH